MKRILRLGNAVWFMLLMLIILTSGCGGGGGVSSSGGNNAPATAFTGKTSQAVITQSNAKVLTDAGSDSGLLSSGAVGSSVGAKPVARTAKFAMQAVSTAPETLNGNCGGNSVTSSTYDSVTGKVSGSTTYNSYCQDGTTENGQTTFSGTLSQANSSLDVTITFSSYSTKDATDDSLMNGSANLQGTIQNGNLSGVSMTMNVDIKDNIQNKVLKLENILITSTYTTTYSEFTISGGKVYHPDYGYFDLSTPTAILTNSGDEYPSSGVLVIAGANGTKGKLTYLSKTQYKVEADETGGGTYTLVGTYDWSGTSSGGAAPAISAITPLSATVGTLVTITGTNFNATPAGNTVKFNGTTATVTSSTAAQIITVVPTSATTGPITVTTTGGTATSSSNFTVTAGEVLASSIVGIWGDLSVSSTNFYNTITREWAPPSGGGTKIEFNQDGTYTKASIFQSTFYGCTVKYFFWTAGNVSINGTTMILTQTENYKKKTDSCQSASNFDGTQPLETLNYNWSIQLVVDPFAGESWYTGPAAYPTLFMDKGGVGVPISYRKN